MVAQATVDLEHAGDDELIALARAGDRGALAVLYDRHKAALYRTALAVTRDTGTAEEILQEGFLRAIRHMDRIDLAPGGSLRPWLHRIVINLAYDWSARRARSNSPLDAVVDRLAVPSALLPDRVAERHEQEAVVAEAVATLPFKQRIVVILFYLHDMDLHEIAEVLNVPEGTVKSRLYYARTSLRAHLVTDARLSRAGVMTYATTEPPVA
jgi:RNA polymerase sigma-70 factor (ECF subfamily)